MEVFTSPGRIAFRTKLMTDTRAWAFATCLTGNVARFTDVEVHQSSRAKGTARYFVIFRPAGADRQAALIDHQMRNREVRAYLEGSDYLWCRDKDGGRAFFWLLSISGEVYSVTEQSCDCPDATYRACPGGCKHSIALRAGLGTIVEPEVIPAVDATRGTQPERTHETLETRQAAARAALVATFGRAA